MDYCEKMKRVLEHADEQDAFETLFDVTSILFDKETNEGLGSFSRTERYIYAIDAMLREVNNGGWLQFFDNSSGVLAYDIVPALEAVGSKAFYENARKALALFGTVDSLEDEVRWKHLETITEHGRCNLWDELDERFYHIGEPLEELTITYVRDHVCDEI